METRLKVTYYTLLYRCLPAVFDGLKVALVSDLHDQIFPGDGNKMLADAILAEQPDFVALAGDMHNNAGDEERYFDFIRRLTQSVPTYFAGGNHDRTARPEYIHRLKETGLFILNGNCGRFLSGEGSDYINISGVSWDDYGKMLPYYDKNAFNIFIQHDPACFDTLPSRPQLMLSGHNHGGVIRLPFGQGLFAPGAGKGLLGRLSPKAYFPKYPYGIYGEHQKLAVTSGLGNSSVQIRFIYPEIMAITLKCAERD